MFLLNENQKQKIKEISCGRGAEVGGFIDESGNVVELQNQSKNRRDLFVSKSTIKRSIIFHSHLTNPEFSDIDIYFANKTKTTLIVYCVLSDTFNIYVGQDGSIPLIGRPSILGILDCIELVKDYYNENLNINLPDFNSDIRYWPMNLIKYRRMMKIPNNALIDFYLSNGFIKVVNDQTNDLVICNSPRIISPHNILINNGGGYLTHNHGEKSKKLNTKPNKSNIICILRHKLNV